ncbi:hypothetical protein [Tahibacter amnicola]|uniref:DNA-binding beta-propeller fold protein YncE n=1 Tax=Tahibacter amnicola TaxID=2976241 RepID=A0ABY6BD69_9GAMM|nr:hypothetical protein [Tahibacter amnicola]UXI67477.1 hypothetical protein N4264_22505 [Tahibacter amnicola]
MKVQALVFALMISGFAGTTQAADQAAAPAAAAPSASADDPMARAAKLTEQEIKSSSNREALGQLAGLYNGKDVERFIWTLERLVELTPNSGELRMQLAGLYAALEDKSKVYDILIRMQAQGFAYDLAKDPRFEKAHGTQVWDYLVKNFEANARPFGEGSVAFELPKGDHLYETLAWDPVRKKFLVGSARDGAVVIADDKGQVTEFIKPDAASGLWSVLDLKVDAENDALWVASAGLRLFKGYNADVVGRAQVLKYKLSTGKLLATYAPEDGNKGHIFTALAVAKGGRVYVADGSLKEIYAVEGDKLKRIAGNQRLSGIRGLAVTDDGKTLYFADPSLGIFGIDLASSKPFAVVHSPERLVVGGIDGMYWYDGCLVIIQRDMVPRRVMRLKLTPDGQKITAVMPLQANHAAFTSPSVGTVAGNSLYFVANSQKALYDSHGVLRDEKLLEPVRIFKNDLRFAWDQPGIPGGPAPIPVQKGDGSVTPPGGQ